MTNKKIWILAAVFMIGVSVICPASASRQAEDYALRIHLPREAVIKDEDINLGQISIIRGAEQLVAKAEEILLGRFTVPGQQIVVDRSMVLSRLACNKIPASDVSLSGAKEVVVKRQQRIITTGEFVDFATDFLKENFSGRSVCGYDPVRVPKDLAVPQDCKDIKLQPRLAAAGVRNHTKVEVEVLADGQQIGVCEVMFRLKYKCRRVVSLVELKEGDAITPENVRFEEVVSNYPEPALSKTIYGLVAKRNIPANTVIHPNMIGPARQPVVLWRNQSVLIKIERPGLLVTAMGKAMQKARAGEYIKVRNIDSQRVIMAKVNDDGTVEPVF